MGLVYCVSCAFCTCLALLLRHGLKDYKTAAEEYERTLDLDPNYQPAHKEYLKILLKESPLHPYRLEKTNKQKQQEPNPISLPTHEPTMDELHEHAERCTRYAIKLMWKSKFNEAKDLLSMALRCDVNHRVARLLLLPKFSINICIEVTPII